MDHRDERVHPLVLAAASTYLLMAVASSMKCTPLVPPVVTIVGVVIVVAPMNATGTPPIFLTTYGWQQRLAGLRR